MKELLAAIEASAPRLLEQYGCPGLAVALLEGGDTEFRTFGLADVERELAVTVATRFHVCSISKAVATWGVMRLVDEGRLDLDVPVDDYLTRWHLPPSEFDNREVTVRRILSHTAGLPVEGYSGIAPAVALPTIEAVLDGGSPPLDERLAQYARKWGMDPATKHERVRVVRKPGTVFSYSGGGYLVLDLLLEELTGMTAAQYLDDAVLAPLGLGSSTFHMIEPGPGVAVPYDEDGAALPHYRVIHKTAGGMSADIRDLARFARAEFASPDAAQVGKGLLTRESFELMFERVMFAERAGGMDFDIGLGHFLGRLGRHRLVQHSGGSAGWRSIYFVLPDVQRGFAALINSSAGNEVWQALARTWGESAAE